MVLAKPSAAFTIWLVKPVPQKGKRKRDGVTLVNAASGTGNIFAVCSVTTQSVKIFATQLGDRVQP